MNSSGSSGFGMIGPGLSVMTLPAEIVIVPPETLLIAPPLPPPDPLPVNVEPLISTRPCGRSSRFGGSIVHA